jgi:hypothetical protein
VAGHAMRLAMAVALSTVCVSKATAQADFTGIWRLDSARSVDLERAFAVHAQKHGFRSQGSSPQAGPGSIPGSSAGSIRLSSGRTIDFQALAAEARQMVYGGDYFEITQTDSSVVFHPLNLANDPAVLYVDGKKRKVFLLMDVEGDLKAEWKGDRLKVERKTPDLQTTEYWLVADDPGFLVVQLEIDGRAFQKKLEIRRVYQRLSP